MRLVDADIMRENLEWCKSQSGRYDDIYWDDVIERLDVQPTVDAVPVVHGQWIHCEGKSSIWYCSVCGEKIIYNSTRKTYKPSKKTVSEINKYCRNCGAKMDLEEQDAKEEN